MADAALLYVHKRVEGAFLNALLAIAASARAKYPASMGDASAFYEYLKGTEADRFSFEFRGMPEKLAKILYKWMRCELAHEGTLPIDIKIVPDKEPKRYFIQAGGGPEKTLKISESYFHRLMEYADGIFNDKQPKA